MEQRALTRLAQRSKLSVRMRHLQPIHLRASHSSSSKPPPPLERQANPLGDYYASILSSSTPAISSAAPTTASPSTTPPITSSSSPEQSIIFSSRLSSPLERRSEIRAQSTRIAGILVPPKPEEPDNCCMSGCVNCVWDRFRDEIEDWAVMRAKADRALAAEEKNKKQKVLGARPSGGEVDDAAQHTSFSMDDDGGGSEGNWGNEEVSEDLFRGVPVGIREFMKSEKRLKEKHKREGTVG